MTKSKRMQPILLLAEQAERDAAQLLRDSHRDVEECERQLDHLSTCRREYLEQMQGTIGGTMSAARMHELRSFIHRLDQAIHQVETLFERKKTANDRRKDQWVGARYRAQALGNVTARYRADEQKSRELKHQIEIDDRPRPAPDAED